MAYVIAEPCVDQNDRSCIEVCPVDCITADACPNAAIFRSDELPVQWLPFARIDATWYRDPRAARASIDELVRR